MKKTIVFMLAAALVAFGFVGCSPKGAAVPGGDGGNLGETGATSEDLKVLDEYLGPFGHVRVLGDIDHVMKGDMDGTMKLATPMAFNETRTELTIPLTLAKYDYDGHKNEGDPEPEKYTRIVTGSLTLTLVGALNAEGTGFVATSYRFTDVDVKLDCDTTTYILLDLPETTVQAEEIKGIFTTKGGISRSSVTVNITEGLASGIADVDTPKFGAPSGAFQLNGKDASF